MTVLRRFSVTMECPADIWRVESVREPVWQIARQRCGHGARDNGYRVFDRAMVPAALTERTSVEFFASVLGGRVPCDEDQADIVTLTLSCWCVPEPADTSA